MKLNKKTPRHPAVVDLLSGAPTTPPGAADTAAPGGPAATLTAPPVSGDGGSRPPRRPNKKLLLGIAGAAAVAVIGGTIAGKMIGSGDHANTANGVTVTADDEDTLPILDLPTTTAAPTTTSTDVGDECRADRGDQKSAAGVISAWNHAYYIQRDAVAARALATPNSSVLPADQLQPFIDGVPVGTTYCQRLKELSEDVYLVDLTELRPEGPNRGTQTVTTREIDGKWFVDVFK
ncbi:hypothetical protein [Prescottella subtropica]|uniref:hypothetical protein n=1 Tax=Prescottella subtropica TaxID=2545757 RepID=UPI0010F4454E|nr:hypothetical protein [Prescottella subtropica]